MRTFNRFLHRRNIKDPQAYFTAKGITTNEELAAWCALESVELPAVLLFAEQKQAKATKKTAEQKPIGDEPWHVPAAERPLKKPQKKRTTTTKKKGK